MGDTIDDINISGNVTIWKDLSSEIIKIDLWATIMGFKIYEVLEEDIDICSNLISINYNDNDDENDQACPSYGSYYFSKSITIQSEMQNIFSSFLNLLGIFGISMTAYDYSSVIKLDVLRRHSTYHRLRVKVVIAVV